MSEHRILPGGSTTDLDSDTIRQRFACPACDLGGTVTVSPISAADELLATLDKVHRERKAGEQS